MTRPTITGFWLDGEWRELKDPVALATWRQLFKLNSLGMLEIVHSKSPITKGEAAAAIDEAEA